MIATGLLASMYPGSLPVPLAYSKNPPTMLVEVKDRNVVEYKDDLAYAFDLGKIIEVNNYE